MRQGLFSAIWAIRRMKHRLVSSAILLLLCAANADAGRSEEALADDVLILAEDVGRWLVTNAEIVPAGIAWPDDVLHPDTISYDLGSGVAGKVLYLAALYRATGHPEYLDMALGGADYLAATLTDPSAFDGNQRKASLYAGIAGIGVAIMQVQQHTSRANYSEALETFVALLDDWSVTGAQGTHWSDEFNDLVYGDAGTILFLSWYAKHAGDQRASDLAHSGARFLLGQANETTDGSFWYFRRSKLFNLPNFSHGTAGIAYVLATVAAETGDESLVQGAQAGFDYIKSIAEFENGLLRIPYGWGDKSWDGLFEFGWAHGLVGTISLFVRLQQTGIDADSAAEYEHLGRHTLENINLPGVPIAPYAEPSTPLDLRFGRAGVLLLSGEEQASLKSRILKHLERAAIRNGQTAYWEVDAPAFMGGGTAAYTGIFHGAAGIGIALLRMHAQLTGRQPYVELPDYPTK